MRHTILVIPLIVIVLVGACMLTSTNATSTATATTVPSSTSEPTATPVPTDTQEPRATDTPEPSPTITYTPKPSTTPALSCDPIDVVERVREKIPYKEFIVNFNELSYSKNLVVWYVDPEINLEDHSIDAFDQTVEAGDRAIQLGSELVKSDPCIGETFMGFNSIVVDQNYNGWISANVMTNQFPLPDSAQTADDRIDAVYSGLLISFVREEYPDPLPPAPADACTWQEAHTALDGEFIILSQGNTTFFFVIDDHGANLWVQLEEPTHLIFLSVVLSVTDCLHPPLDNMIVFFVQPDGSVTFSGRLPKEGIANEDFDLFEPFP